MQYRPLGTTGMHLSRLGFGSMRLPMKEVDGSQRVDEDIAIPLMQRAFELGVNYVDSAYFYCENTSEYAVGKALKGWRDKVYLSTKYPFRKDFRETLEEQLKKLDTDYIDLYHFHGISTHVFENQFFESAVAGAIKAKEEGLVRHMAFSYHGKPEEIGKIIDIGIFESVLIQYNLFDRSNEGAMAEAKSRGLGVIVMGPVGGGRVVGLPKEAAEKWGVPVRSNAELALRFVFSNPNVDCAISGMTSIPMVEENVAIASNIEPLSAQEIADISASMDENKRLANLYCTGCNYCLPHCQQQVNISAIFQAMNYLRVYGLKEFAQEQYDNIGTKWVKGTKADACIQCGECESHCPQNINIIEQLEECRQAFG